MSFFLSLFLDASKHLRLAIFTTEIFFYKTVNRSTGMKCGEWLWRHFLSKPPNEIIISSAVANLPAWCRQDFKPKYVESNQIDNLVVGSFTQGAFSIRECGYRNDCGKLEKFWIFSTAEFIIESAVQCVLTEWALEPMS